MVDQSTAHLSLSFSPSVALSAFNKQQSCVTEREGGGDETEWVRNGGWEGAGG